MRIFLVISIPLLVTSCDSYDEDFTETFTYNLHSQSEIFSDTTSRQISQDSSITVYNFSIQSGDSIVFEYQRDVNPPETVLDGGLVETLLFQIPSTVNSFEFRDKQLSNARTFYRRGCFCPLSGAGFKVNNGIIEGETLSANIWFVRADVTVSAYNQNYEVQFEGVFREQ